MPIFSLKNSAKAKDMNMSGVESRLKIRKSSHMVFVN